MEFIGYSDRNIERRIVNSSLCPFHPINDNLTIGCRLTITADRDPGIASKGLKERSAHRIT